MTRTIASLVVLGAIATACSTPDNPPVKSAPQPAPSMAAAQPATATPPKPAKATIPKAVQLNNAGVEKLNKGDYKGAVKDFSQAIQANPKLVEAYLGRGVAHSSQGNRQAAMKDYNQAIRLNPKFAEAYQNRADEQIALGNQKAAIADLQQAAKLFTQQGDKAQAKLAQTRLADVKTLAATPPETLEVVVANASDNSEQGRSTPVQQPRPVAARPAAAPVSARVALANHLTSIGAKMYATYWCPYCRRQEALFGEGVSRLKIIECDPGGANAQPQVCDAANVSSYPTWEINGQLYRGMRPLENLADISGYEGPRNFGS